MGAPRDLSTVNQDCLEAVKREESLATQPLPKSQKLKELAELPTEQKENVEFAATCFR